MAKIKFENGTTVNFNGTPTQQDIEEISQKLNLQKPQQADHGFLGDVAAGILKTPARLATNLVQAAEIATGNKQTTPFSGSFLGDVQPVGQANGGGLSAQNLKDSLGAGLEMSSYLVGGPEAKAGLEALSTGEKLIAPTLKETLMSPKLLGKATLSHLKSGGIPGGLMAGGQSLQDPNKTAGENITDTLGGIATGTGLSSLFGLGGRAIESSGLGNKIFNNTERAGNVETQAKSSIDNNVRKMTQGITGDASQIENLNSQIKSGIDRLNQEAPNLQVPDTSKPIGSGAMKPLNLQKAKPNEIISAVNQMGQKIATIAQDSAKLASEKGVKLDVSQAKNAIQDALNKGDIKKGAANTLNKQLDALGNDPFEIHNFVQDINNKLGSKYESGNPLKVPDEVKHNIGDALRKSLNTVVDRTGYAKAYGDNQALKKMILILAKKANKEFNLGNLASDAGVDASFAGLLNNPAYIFRSLFSDGLKGVLNNYRNKSGIKAFKNTLKGLNKLDSEANLPVSGIKYEPKFLPPSSTINVGPRSATPLNLGDYIANDFYHNSNRLRNSKLLSAPSERIITPNTDGTPNISSGSNEIGGLRQRLRSR